MTRKNAKLRLKILRLLRPWHRRLGIFGVVFTLCLAISGILINHSNDLAIDSTHVNQIWLLDYYGIKVPKHLARYVFPTESKTETTFQVTDNLLWLNHQKIWQSDSTILAVSSYKNFYIAITKDALAIFSAQGQLLETQDSSTSLPQNIIAIGIDSARLWLSTTQGQYIADSDLIEWQQAMPFKAIDWQSTKPLSTAEQDKIAALARSAHLNWERVLLDLHSGRFFGKAGQLFVDLIAICLILICCSGFLIWYKQKVPKHPK